MNTNKSQPENNRTRFREWLKNWEIVANWISKIFTFAIPLVLAYFVLNQNKIQNSVAERAYELKLVELAWNSYLTGDSLSTSKALNLIETLEPKVAAKLASIISKDTTQTNDNRQFAAKIVVNKTTPPLHRKSNRKIVGPSVAVTATTLAYIPSVPQFVNKSENSITFIFDNNKNSDMVEYAIYVIMNGKDLGFLKSDGTVDNSVPTWQKYSEWGTVTVKSLTAGTSYSFKIKARNEARVETEFSPISQSINTLSEN